MRYLVDTCEIDVLQHSTLDKLQNGVAAAAASGHLPVYQYLQELEAVSPLHSNVLPYQMACANGQLEIWDHMLQSDKSGFVHENLSVRNCDAA